tara:strand:- start:409 stop:1155 length:747 start_codon:yes stop_codon:yes gene_type:complete
MALSLLISGSLVLGTGGLFHLLENRLPLETVDRKKDLTFDILVILLTTVIVAFLTIWLLDGYVRDWLISNVQLMNSVLAFPLALRISLAIIIGDFGYYVVHRMMHTAPLWRTHVFHHSIQEVYWFSGLRTSAMNSLIIRLPYLVALCMFGIPTSAVALIAVSLAVINFWVHSNINISLGPLNYLLITPPFHRIHHSMAEQALDRNFGNILSCWDYLFGTAVAPNQMLNESEKGFEVKSEELARQLMGL